MSNNQSGLDFLVNKEDWAQHRFVDVAVPELGPGQVLFRLDRFAFTANNISYAFAGDLLGYWQFFPATDGWGRLPVMGFGEVVGSTHPDVAEGIRCFGFYPMSRHLVIEPGDVAAGHIMDAAAHRKGFSPFYNQYIPTHQDPIYQPEHEDILMLLRGLFMTSFLADDFLGDNDYFGAEKVLISSASSKTAIAFAYLVSQTGRVSAVGLTSAGNLEFVRDLGCYDQVLTYEEIPTLDGQRPAVYVDLAGSGTLLRAVHGHFGDRLGHSCAIGATHWDADRNIDGLPGPAPTFFFAPEQARKRIADWGAPGFQERLGTSWSSFRSFTEGWLELRRGYGRAAVERVYLDTLRGSARPEQGQLLSLWDSSAAATAA